MEALIQRCGVIGMGMIGAGVAECLVRKGRQVSGYDVRPEAVAAVKGVKACASPAELARDSDVVIIAVVNAEQAREVLFGSQGIADGIHPRLVVALMSTISIPLVIEFAKMAEQKGFKLIDVAIATGGSPTSSGTSGLMAGGDAETIDSVRSVMEDFSSIFAHMGPLGAGMAAKIARAILTYGEMNAAYEAGQLAEAAGVDLGKLTDVIRKSDPQNIQSTILWKVRGVKPLQGLPEEAMAKFRGYANLLHKDLDACIDLAKTLDVEVPGAELSMARGDLIYGLPPGTTKVK